MKTIVCILTVAMVSFSMLNVVANESGLYVQNLSPSFNGLQVSEHDGYSIVKLNIIDYNSFRDIKLIFFNVTHNDNVVLSIAYLNIDNITGKGTLVDVVGENLAIAPDRK